MDGMVWDLRPNQIHGGFAKNIHLWDDAPLVGSNLCNELNLP